MPTIIRSAQKSSQPSPAFARSGAFRRPHYDCQEQAGILKLTVYVPGVDPAGVELEVSGPDLVVTAPKAHPVRLHWRALHLESAQRDYQLRLRLGHGLAYSALQADLRDGVLTVRIPKKTAPALAAPALA